MASILDRVAGGKRMVAVGMLFLLVGGLAAIRSTVGLVRLAELEIGTELLLLPAGIGILRSSLGWLRFARWLVILTMVVTVALVAFGATMVRVETVSVGTFAGSSAPFWRIVLVGAIHLAIEGIALAWMTRELKTRPS